MTNTTTATVSIEGPHFDMRGFWKAQAASQRATAASYRRLAEATVAERPDLAEFALMRAECCEQWAKEDEAKAI